LSFEIQRKIFNQQTQGNYTAEVDTELLEAMINQWSKLRQYYEYSVDDQSDNHEPDLEMSLYMIANYLSWRDSVSSMKQSAKLSGEQEREKIVESLLTTLENSMSRILKTTRSLDQFKDEAVDHQRPVIEKRICELSSQIDGKVFDPEEHETYVAEFDVEVLKEVLSEWFRLSQHYKHSLDDPSENHEPDLEMSLYLVANYFDWRQYITILIYGAMQDNGYTKRQEFLEDHGDDLDNSMNKILEAAINIDEFQL
jgi:hypothetical protein